MHIRRIMNKLLIPFFIFFGICCSMAQSPPGHEQGLPYVRNFAPDQYKAHAQNFAIAQEKSGIIYFGNFAGVLQFDGEFWRLILTAKTSKITALAIDSLNRVYVGARGEIGMLVPNKNGKLVFKNLLESVPGVPSFLDVLQIFITPHGVLFVTQNCIFIWNQGKMELWKPGNEIISCFYLYNTIYLQLKSIGLVTLKEKKIHLIKQGEIFGGSIEIKSMLPYKNNEILIASGTQGLYLLDQNGIRDIFSQADQLFEKNLITAAVKLNNGDYAFGTSRSGIIILSADGAIKQIVDKKATLRNESIQTLYIDHDNNLWAALNNGIAMIKIPAPLTYFDDKSGLNGGVNHILRYGGHLYVSTYQGLFYYDDKKMEFVSVPEIITACWSVVPFENSLLAATSQGVFIISDHRAHMIKEGFSMALIRSKKDPSLVLVGEMDGLYSLKYNHGTWKSEKLNKSEEEINNLEEDNTGNIWGISLSKGVFRYFPGDQRFEYFNISSGLPETAGSTINMLHGNVAVATRKGVFIFNETSHTFKCITLLGNDTAKGNQWFSSIVETSGENLWVNAGDETQLTLLKKSKKGYIPFQTPFLPIAEEVIWSIFPEDNGSTWFGGPDGLIKYDSTAPAINLCSAPAIIRRISTHNDSLIFSPDNEKMVFSHQDNSLRFEFAAPYFSVKGENQYQYLLEGFEETWSDWMSQTHKEYTNLPKGNFVFHVRARNVFGKISAEATFPFTILAPWYLSWWAYFMYLIAASGLIYLIVITRSRKLLKEKKVLEQKIVERTAQVVQQKEEIEKQSEELANKNDELEKINIVVKAINSEINFSSLLQSLLEKTRMIKSVEKSTALVFDKNLNVFKFKASHGWDMRLLEPIILQLSQAEKRYLKNADEIYEDIFLKTDFSTLEDIPALNETGIPKSMLTLVIKAENKVEAFLILENMHHENAFDIKDLNFIRNSKEHIISAFIKTRILEDLQSTLQHLKDTQDQLVQSEKLASLGALTAGIAHEIQNPLNFVNNFSSLSGELADEVSEFLEGIKDQLSTDQYADISEVIEMIKGNVKKINEHGKRAESIVKGMLQHSRGRTGEFEEVDINNMVSEYVNLAYHGMRAKDKSFNTSIKTYLDPEVGKAYVIPQDLSRVILNIVNNSCYALDEKTKKQISGFAPEVVISTKKIRDKIEIRIKDNGTGIPEHVLEKIFNPFFTTKPTGKGTGLGLSMSYDIITQLHKGKLEVNSKEGAFTEFVITIPQHQS